MRARFRLVMDYHCTNCARTFDGFPAANNHEKAHGYQHICMPAQYFGEAITRVEELVICALPSCETAVTTAEAVFDNETDQLYCSDGHKAEGVILREIGFYGEEL